MAIREIHCKDCIEKLGEPFDYVHKWLDELFPEYHGSYAHRDKRHNLEAIEFIRNTYGEKAYEAAKIHICRDWGIIESELPINEEDAAILRQLKYEEYFNKKHNKLGYNNPYEE